MLLLIFFAAVANAQSPGISPDAVNYLSREGHVWLDASTYCNTRGDYDSSTLAMLRAHFAESASHFVSVSTEDVTQKQGTDRIISKAICIKDMVTGNKIGDNSTADFLLEKIGKNWTTAGLDKSTSINNQLAKAASRIEVVRGYFVKERNYMFKAVKYHYDFACITTESSECSPVDQLHCVRPSSTEDGKAWLFGKNSSESVCYIRQQPIHLSPAPVSVVGALQFPILSMSYSYMNRKVKYNASAQFNTNTYPGINDAKYSTYVPGVYNVINNTRNRKGTMIFDKSASWRAVPSEIEEMDYCRGAKGSITQNQAINGGFPLVAEAKNSKSCILGHNYDQVQAIEDGQGVKIRGIGRTLATGYCGNASNIFVRGYPAWTDTVAVRSRVGSDGFPKPRDICVDYLNYYPDNSNTTLCKMSYCAPLYVGLNQLLIRISPKEEANYTAYGGNWPRSQYNVDESKTIKDGILCNTEVARAELALSCLGKCINEGYTVGYLDNTERCANSTSISAICRSLLEDYYFSVVTYGIDFPGYLAQTGANTELSNVIIKTTQATQTGVFTKENYVGQNTLLYSAMGSNYGPAGCATDFGKFADLLEGQRVNAVGEKENGAVQALLNATTVLDPVEDDSLEYLVSTAVEQAILQGMGLTAVDVAVVIATGLASLASVIDLMSKEWVQSCILPRRSDLLLFFVFLIGLLIVCTIGLMPLVLAIKQEIDAINTVVGQRNIYSKTTDLGVYDTRYENVYLATVEVTNNPDHGLLYVVLLAVACGIWVVTALSFVVFAVVKAVKRKAHII